MEDLRRLRTLVDWDFVERLLARGGLRWLGRRLPYFIRTRIDPFSIDGILDLSRAPLS
jgi:hypothetical protein